MPATNWFRKNRRKLLGLLVIFLMVIWGIGPAIEYLVPKPPVGQILGKNISQEEFNDTVIRWARVFFRDTKEPIAEQIWKQLALVRQAEEMGVFVTNEELAQEIRSWLPVDPQVFSSREGYRHMLGSVFHLTEYQFEKTIREYLLAQKLQFLLKDSIKITRDEALQRYMKENEKVKVKYVAFKAKDFVGSVEVEEDEIRSFYDKYSGNFPNEGEGTWGYKEPEKVKIEYIIARYDIIEKQVDITDEEMHEYYESKKDLMFKKEAEGTLDDAEKPEGETVDQASITEYKPFEEVKGQIEAALRFKKREALANRLIGDVDNEIYENIEEGTLISFSELASKYGLSYVVPTNPNDGTNYFAKDELNGIVIGVENFPQLVFDREVNDPSPPLSSLEGKLIYQVLERIAPRIPPYEEIHDVVAKDLRYEKAFREAEAFAKRCLEKIAQTSFEEGIKIIEEERSKLQIVETDYFSRPGIGENNYIKVLGSDRRKLATKAFELKNGETAIAVEDKGEKTCYVVKLVDRKGADLKKFEEKKDSIMERYLFEKQLAFLSEWESQVHKKTHLGKNKS